MKKTATIFALIAIVSSMTSLTANGASEIFTGSISPSTLGSSVTTDLPMFNSALGTLTGVQVTLNFMVTPFATVANFTSGTPLPFTSSDYISYSYSPADTWTISNGSDSWNLAAPTVSTGNIYGSGQGVAFYTGPSSLLQLVGSISAAANLTAASGLDFAAYTGAGYLAFGTTGSGYVSITDGPLFGGGGANLTGTASVTYDFVPVPEPATISLVVIGMLGALTIRRRKV